MVDDMTYIWKLLVSKAWDEKAREARGRGVANRGGAGAAPFDQIGG